MTGAVIYQPGEKTHRDENFPVASWLIRKQHRAVVLAFYRFARAADDVADHPDLSEREKISQLDQFEATLLGRNDAIADALPLRKALAERSLTSRHALDLLIAFRQDARKSRYQDWDELMQYCAHSAAPVGRFVLDVHGENRTLWPASDALCSALQIINHIQDCRADYQRLDRVYIPQMMLEAHGATVEELGATHASEALRECLRELVSNTQSLMASSYFSDRLRDRRLGLEVAVIERLAEKLLTLLATRDPLSERVHLRKSDLMFIMMKALFAGMGGKRSPQISKPLPVSEG